jgi:hypothetical protein
MRLYRAKDRGIVYTRIFTYKQRRDEVRKQYGVVNGIKAPNGYKARVKRLNNKIANWRKVIAEIDKRNNKVMAIANHISYFMAKQVKNSATSTDKTMILARCIFCKYGLENGIPATYLSDYIGYSRGDTVARMRLKFNEHLRLNKQPYRDIWNRWKLYMEDIESRES